MIPKFQSRVRPGSKAVFPGFESMEKGTSTKSGVVKGHWLGPKLPEGLREHT